MYGDSLEHSVENSDLFSTCSNSDLKGLASPLRTARNHEMIEKIAAIYIFCRTSRAVVWGSVAHGRAGVLEKAFID